MSQAAALSLTLLYWIASTGYFHRHRGTRPGYRRAAVCAPLFMGVFLIPLLYDYHDDPLTVMTVFSMLCLAGFKVRRAQK
jgi:hypothetical protein